MKKDSKILVLGGAGLVGTALVNTLVDKGYTNVSYSVNRREVIHKNAKMLKCDLIDEVDTRCLFLEAEPEYVFLAAAKVGGIIANSKYPADFIYDNLKIQNNVIHYAYKHNVTKLMFLGSSCIYPKNCEQPIKEDYLLTGKLEETNDAYALAKIAGIKMCESYNKQYNTNFISVMPTNLYGIYDNFNLEKSHVLPAILKKMYLSKLLQENNISKVKNILKIEDDKILSDTLSENNITPDSITLWGTGEPMREFLYSDDMADACIHVMNKVNSEDTINKHINIGTGKDISIKNLALLIKEVIDYKGEILFDTDKPDGTKRKLLDVSNLNKLGWSYKTELKEGIEKVYKKVFLEE